jgi:hypothetical protein
MCSSNNGDFLFYEKQKGRAAQSSPSIKMYISWVGYYLNSISTPPTPVYYDQDGSPLTAMIDDPSLELNSQVEVLA